MYEWNIEVHKVTQKRKREHLEWESNASLAREIIAAIYNTAGKSFKKQFESKEFIKLSFDNEEVITPKETREMTPEEIKSKFGKQIKE